MEQLTDNIPPYLQKTTVAQMLSIGGERVVILVLHFPVMQFQLITVVTSETLKANFAAILLRPQESMCKFWFESIRPLRLCACVKKARFRVDFFLN